MLKTANQQFVNDIRVDQRDPLNFIVYHKAANKIKLSRQTFASIIGIQTESLRRRVFAIKRERGIPMIDLQISAAGAAVIDDALIEKFKKAVADIREKVVDPNDYISSVLDNNDRKTGTYIITAAQNATPVNDEFFRAIMTYAEHNDAKLLVIPYRYKNPTSVFSTESPEWWASAVKPYIVDKTVRLSKELVIIGSVKIQPTAVEPLSGFEGYTGTSSALFGHPKVQQKIVPAVSTTLPKILVTTGAVTQPNYTDSKAGFKGNFHHSYAALVVEVTETEFHVRHVHYKADGFYDLDKFYGADGTVTTDTKIAALVTGDTHALFLDKQVEAATYSNADSICNTLKPDMKIFHDLTDFYSRNHHHRGDDLTQYAKYHYDLGNVEKELQASADLLDRYNQKDTGNVIVKSNHDEAFDRWLRESEPKGDPENAKFYYYMKYNQLKYMKYDDEGSFSTIDPFEFWCSNPDSERGLGCVDNTVFLKRDQSLMVAGVELSFHGDRGPNGSKGSIKSFAKVAEKCIIGHSHTPGIYEGAYQVGTSSRLKLDYNTGPSGWMHTHAIVYQDGSRTLINIINGKWRAQP